jgi:hypothetical protein
MHPDFDVDTTTSSNHFDATQDLFLNVIRSGPGYIGSKSPTGKFQQQHFKTTQEAIDIIEMYAVDANVWGSVASFNSGTSRFASNAISIKSFWLDVDAHGTGPYKTPDDALDAVKSFIAANGLPKPNYINMTGHGTQVFWTLEEAIAAADWQPVADDLQELAKRCDLDADHITGDPARILRMPGTFNFRNPENPVEAVLHDTNSGFIDLHAFHAAIKAALTKLPPPPPKPAKPKTLPSGVTETPENIALVKAMLAVLDPDSEYPDWRDINWGLAASGLSVAEDLARDWSAKGEDWDEDAFNTVWNSYDPDRGKSVGFGTLVFKAREAGYTGDIPREEEVFEKLVFKNDTTTATSFTVTHKGLVTQRASDIEPEQVEWLIEGAIPMGMLVVIGGQPGMGKSQIAIKLAAAITTGEGLPDA